MAVKIFITPQSIASRNAQIAHEIKERGYDNLLVVPILTGALIFAADLIRYLSMENVTSDVWFVSVSSNGQDSLSIRSFLPEGLAKDRNILLVDDAVGTGHTLYAMQNLLKRCGAKSVVTCALIDVPSKRAFDLTVDHVGFICPDYYFVGYGMDSDSGNYRGLPFVGICDDGDDAAYHSRLN